MWSVGCILAELLTLKPFFTGRSEVEQLGKIYKVIDMKLINLLLILNNYLIVKVGFSIHSTKMNVLILYGESKCLFRQHNHLWIVVGRKMICSENMSFWTVSNKINVSIKSTPRNKNGVEFRPAFIRFWSNI